MPEKDPRTDSQSHILEVMQSTLLLLTLDIVGRKFSFQRFLKRVRISERRIADGDPHVPLEVSKRSGSQSYTKHLAKLRADIKTARSLLIGIS